MSNSEQRLRAGRFVAKHWLDAYLRYLHDDDSPGQWGIGTHPLNLVIAALDGETDPVELGLTEDAHADFRAKRLRHEH